ncbi:unnamed protein product [Gadus morhua 'NCC']
MPSGKASLACQEYGKRGHSLTCLCELVKGQGLRFRHSKRSPGDAVSELPPETRPMDHMIHMEPCWNDVGMIYPVYH